MEERLGVARSWKVRNTFIDDGSNQRSPSLERMLQQGRRIRSCPGSQAPTPRGAHPGSEESSQWDENIEVIHFSDVVSEGSKMTSIHPKDADSDASIIEKTSCVEGMGFDTMTAHISLQVAAWSHRLEHQHMQQSHQSYNKYGQRPMLQPASATALGSETSARAVEQPPRLGSEELPSVGSLGHHIRRCKPCAFMTRQGCTSGEQCKFCHLCGAGEKKRRRKEKRALLGAARKLATAQANSQ